MRLFILIIIPFLLASCTNREDPTELMQNDLIAYSTQAANIQASVEIERTSVAATVVSSQNTLGQLRNYNQVIVATIRANQVPTSPPILIAQGGQMPLEFMVESNTGMMFEQVGMAGFVDPQTNCRESYQDFFSTNASIIYLTATGINVPSGTDIVVNWTINGELRYTTIITSSSSESRQCLAFGITPNETFFTVGNWTASLMVNGREIRAQPFSILGQ
jgi:hypothetical protein